MEFRCGVPVRNWGEPTKFIQYDGKFSELAEKLQLNDRVVGISYQEYMTLIPLMDKKFNRDLNSTCYGDPLTIFFAS